MDLEDLCGGSVERWRRIDEILALVLEAPAEEQNSTLDMECAGDDALRQTIEELLVAHRASGHFMEESMPKRLGAPDDLLHLTDAPAPGSRGQQVGVYQLERQLGCGGMGEVWLASRADGEFEQTVAIKLLNGRIDSAGARQRLRRERQILARLDHPNIARLLDGGTLEDGRPYFVMERVEGERIDVYCARRKLPLEERLRLMLMLSQAIASAHRLGLVHRDLKPANVLVTTEGMVKLVDFGIAKQVASEQSGLPLTGLTLAGQRPMTPGYASPEQVRGDAVTTATDIYGLGALCYELVTGCRPFPVSGLPAYAMEQAVCEHQVPSPSEAVVSNEPKQIDIPGLGTVSLAPPEPPPELRRRLQIALDPVLTRALSKDMAERQSSVEEFARELEEARAHTLGTNRHRPLVSMGRLKQAIPALTLLLLALHLQGFSSTSIDDPSPAIDPTPWAARLPHMEEILRTTELSTGPLLLFVPFAGDQEEHQSLNFLMTNALWSSMASRRDLRLIGERSSWEVRNSRLTGNAHSMAAAVDADFVLWGNTTGEGSSLRLQVQLGWALDGRIVWSQETSLTEADLAQVLDEIEAATARALGLSAPPPGKLRQHMVGWQAAGKSWPSPAALEYAEAFRKKAQGRESWCEAEEHLERALEADPTMAPAWTLQAEMNNIKLLRATSAQTEPALAAAIEAAIARSLELDPSFFRTHLLLSDLQFVGQLDLASTGESILQALLAKPMFTSAIHYASWLASASGDLEAAVTLAQRAVALDPLDPDAQMNLAQMLHASGRHEDALRQLEVSRILEPERRALESLRSLILIARSDPQAAREVAALEVEPGFRSLGIALAEHALGNRPASDEALHWLVTNRRETFAFQIAQVHACRGELEDALKWLHIAAEQRDPGLTYTRRVSCFSAARDDPRMRKLVSEILPLPKDSKMLPVALESSAG